MNWKLGDTIEFSFYESLYSFNGRTTGQLSSYYPQVFVPMQELLKGQDTDFPLDHFFDNGTYTIVGLYTGNVNRFDDDWFSVNEGMNFQTVLFPSTSIANQPDPKISQYSTTIRLEPLMIHQFLSAAQASGLMDVQRDGYQLGLTVDDHGLSNMTAGLESLAQISKLTLMLACITAGLSVIVLAVLQMLQNRKQVAAMRSMGVRRGQTVACMLAGVLLVCFVGAALGALAGQVLSERVAENILASAQQDTLDSTFSAMLAATEGEDAYQAQVESDPQMTVLSAGAVFLALLAVSSALMAAEAAKPPLLMLGVKE